jgi:RNA polymerase sigma-70 factor, ECF subfamily
MVRSQGGDRDAFGELMRRHQQAVFNTAYRLLGNRQDAEDATQEAFIRAYRALTAFDTTRPPAPWLKKIAANICLNRLEAAPPAAVELDDKAWGELPGSPHPEDVAQSRAVNRRLRSEVLNLPPRYRAVIELRHFQELSYDEIALALKRPLSDVKSDLFRARKLLAERLKELKIP